MGTPEFAVASLDAMVRSGMKPIAVVTGPDKKRGRGQKISATAVKQAALRHGIEVILQPEDVKDPQFAEDVAALRPDIIVVVAFRILPERVFELARMGTFNLHGSLLPRYRGAAPIHHAVMQGDSETGVTTFFLKKKVDTGQIILKRALSIGPDETTGDVHDRMMVLGGEVVVETIQRIKEGKADPKVQDDSQATAAPKIFRKDCLLDFNQPTQDVHNKIRGLSPFPGAFTFVGGKQLKVFRSTQENASEGAGESLAAAGMLFSEGNQLFVQCADGPLQLLEVQLEGKKRIAGDAFVRGHSDLLDRMLGE